MLVLIIIYKQWSQTFDLSVVDCGILACVEQIKKERVCFFFFFLPSSSFPHFGVFLIFLREFLVSQVDRQHLLGVARRSRARRHRVASAIVEAARGRAERHQSRRGRLRLSVATGARCGRWRRKRGGDRGLEKKRKRQKENLMYIV